MEQKYNIGDKLYRVDLHILEYTVISIKIFKTAEHEEVFYILRCDSCRGHDNCEIATRIDEYGDLVYSHMINNNSEDEQKQFYWHNDRDKKYFRTRGDAQLHLYKMNLDFYEKSISELQEKIVSYEKSLQQTKTNIEVLLDTQKKDKNYEKTNTKKR